MKRTLIILTVAGALALGGCGAGLQTGTSNPAPTTNYPAGLVKHDMPDGWPAVYTWCENGTRVVMSYQAEGGSHNNPTLALTSSPGCG